MGRRKRPVVDRLAMSVTPDRLRNPGPTWGFGFLRRVQRLPRPLLRPLMVAGAWVAVGVMRVQRRHSREFLLRVRGRRATWLEVWRHFFAYVEFLMVRLRLADGSAPRCSLAGEDADEFEALMASGEPALFGTFHFGHSDLLGFLLPQRGRNVAMIRLRVANSDDTRMLEQQLGGAVRFIWVNEPEQVLFAVKAAIERGDSLAMQCDRLYAAKAEGFEFLGARRLFPFTIYHLAVLFDRPVMFCFGLPDRSDGTLILPMPLFRPDARAGRDVNLLRARQHFQDVLHRLESLVRQHPMLWFNFLPLNPEAAERER